MCYTITKHHTYSWGLNCYSLCFYCLFLWNLEEGEFTSSNAFAFMIALLKYLLEVIKLQWWWMRHPGGSWKETTIFQVPNRCSNSQTFLPSVCPLSQQTLTKCVQVSLYFSSTFWITLFKVVCLFEYAEDTQSVLA